MYNITIVGINFYPEDSSTGLYSTQMAQYLAAKYQVSVITGFPYYPEWKIKTEYQNYQKYLIEKKDNIEIYRYKQYVPSIPTFKRRVLHLLDFTCGSIKNIFKIKKSDLVICIVPFTSTIVLGILLARLRGAKLWIHIQDFEFDAAIESGLVNKNSNSKVKKSLFQGLFWLEKLLLRQATLVSTISYSMLQKLEKKVDVQNYFFPNWVDEHFIDPSQTVKHKFMSSDKFKILYAGNIGAKQDWEFFIRIAKYFAGHEGIEFLVVGAGSKKEWFIDTITVLNLKNVHYFMPVEYSSLANLLCSANLHVLFQKNDVIDTVMPSKILGMMASAKPSLVTGNLKSEVARVFKESNGGMYYDSYQYHECIDYIQKLMQDHAYCNFIGKNAREYITQYFSSKYVLEKFSNKIEEIIA